jgi:hypothetical protein
LSFINSDSLDTFLDKEFDYLLEHGVVDGFIRVEGGNDGGVDSFEMHGGSPVGSFEGCKLCVAPCGDDFTVEQENLGVEILSISQVRRIFRRESLLPPIEGYGICKHKEHVN